jgi:SAM-dependent methyltransferase
MFRGIDFQGGYSVEELGLDPEKSNVCSPSRGRFLTKIFSDLKITTSDAILDIGCGKGNAMRAMIKFPFRSIDGIELSKRVALIARKNFEILHEDRCRIYNLDATSFDGYSKYNIFYLYHPFLCDVFKVVMRRINETRESEQEIVLIYNNPVCHEFLADFGFTKVKEYPEEWGNGIFVYSNNVGLSTQRQAGHYRLPI